MNKLLPIGLSVLLVIIFAAPVMALEHVFGGYWRVRAYNNTNFTGDDTGELDNQQADTRVRLYYTAIPSDEIKLVTKFEIDAIFGDDRAKETKEDDLGDIGADGKFFEVKNVYADINHGEFNLKLGIQPITLARGFLFDDDFSGGVVTYMGEDMAVPIFWIKAYEGGYGDEANDLDVDYYGAEPTFSWGDIQLNPVLMYIKSEDAQDWADYTGDYEALDIYFLGVSLDFDTDIFSLWFTGIYEGGSKDDWKSGKELDVSASLAALGGSVNMETWSVHAQTFYASGDDDAGDSEATAFFVPRGQSYYWAEIMGYGLIDEQVSNGSPADTISNIMVFNVGVTVPLGRLSLMFDIWNANLVEDNASGDTELGTEFDLSASYQLKDNLKLQAVAAYLAAGDATGGGDENPTELGVQMSMSF